MGARGLKFFSLTILLALAGLGARSAIAAQPTVPVDLTDLVTDMRSLHFEASASYANAGSTALPLGVRSNSDVLSTDVGIRYGMARDTEVSLSARHAAFHERLEFPGGRQTRSGARWTGLSGSIRHHVARERERPGLILRLDSGLVRGGESQQSYYGAFSAATYRSLAPVFLVGSVSWRYSGPERSDLLRMPARHSLRAAASMAFNVNSWITLTGGVNWRWREGAELKRDRVWSEHANTRTALNIGVSQSVSDRLSLRLTTDFPISEQGEAAVTAALVYKVFGA